MEIEGLGWLAGGGDRRVWDRWEMRSFNERERLYVLVVFIIIIIIINK